MRTLAIVAASVRVADVVVDAAGVAHALSNSDMLSIVLVCEPLLAHAHRKGFADWWFGGGALENAYGKLSVAGGQLAAQVQAAGPAGMDIPITGQHGVYACTVRLTQRRRIKNGTHYVFTAQPQFIQ